MRAVGARFYPRKRPGGRIAARRRSPAFLTNLSVHSSEVLLTAWGGLILRTPDGVRISDLPRDFRPEPFGSDEEIQTRLTELFPDQRHLPGRSYIEGDQFWLELNYRLTEDQGLRTCIGVRSSAGQGALLVLKQVCEAFGARLDDEQTGDFADLEAETRESMKIFREFRDRNLPRRASSAGGE